MNPVRRRARYQAGSLNKEARANGSAVWTYRWREKINGRSVKKKVILGAVKELTKTQAQKKADEYRELANTPQPVGTNSSLTVAELVKHYQEHELGEDSGRAEKPRKAYRYILKNYILPEWGDFPLGAVKAVAVEAWLKTLSLANGSKAKIREVFSAAFRHAMRHELFPTNPIAHVRQARKRATEPEILEPAEIASLLRELENIEPARTAFLIGALMGMRRGEIFGLKWADVDLERAVLHVRRSYVDGVEGLPKTDSSRRPLPIPGPVAEALTSWKSKSSYPAQDAWIFASDISFGNQPLWPASMWRRNIAPAIERAEIKKRKVGWHTLRRSYASILQSVGANLRVSMELMRHSTPDMTLATYAQSIGEDKRVAGEKVASVVIDAASV